MLAAHFTNGYAYFVFLFWMPTFFHEKYPTAQVNTYLNPLYYVIYAVGYAIALVLG